MPNPIVHFEIRSPDPDASREFYGALLGWSFPPAVLEGYTYVDTGVEGALNGGIGSIGNDEDPVVTVFAAVDDVPATLAEAERLGGKIVQPPFTVPGAGVTFGLFADPHGQVVGAVKMG